MMYFQVCFPSGKCYAAEAHDPSSPEWPPHPSRLFSALVASAYRSDNGITETKRRALEWLESLPPPSIAAPHADLSPAPVTYVPPGDVQGRKGKKGLEQYEHGVHRWRQPRHFPSAIILDNPVVYYGWEEEPEGDMLPALKKIAAGVTHIGTSHSISVVSLKSGMMTRPATLLPDQMGTHFMRTAAVGRLQELEEVFEQKSGVRHPTPACEPLASYRSIKKQVGFDREIGADFLSVRISGTMHGADNSAYLARAVRKAVMSVLGDKAPSAVHGHSEERHVGWLPLPDVGHPNASGRVVGIGFMIPQKLPSEQRRDIFEGIGRVRKLCLPDGRVAQLIFPLPGERLPVALSGRTWTKSSDIWATVTPVVLDRPPKRLTEERVRIALSESLAFAGYPQPEYIEVSTFSVFQGAPPAFRVPAKKPRYHAVVQFKKPISGPVIAGRLRYFGVGLFRPLSSFEGAGESI